MKKRYSSKQGTDFVLIYAPGIKYSTLRLVLAWVTSQRMRMVQVDVESSILNGNLREELYISQPE